VDKKLFVFAICWWNWVNKIIFICR